MDRKKCSEVGHWRDHMRRRRKPCQSSLFTGGDACLLVVSRPNGQNGDVAKLYKLRGARSRRREGSLGW
jgi:hypothetical protein